MTSIDLSKNDTKILDAVFDPESSTSTPNIEIDLLLPPDPHIRNLSLLTALRAQELSAIRIVEQYTPSASSTPRSSTSSDSEDEPQQDAKDLAYQKALHILNAIISEHPTYSSAYNNRAQLHRWRYGDKNTLVQAEVQDLQSPQEIMAYQPQSLVSTRAIANAIRDLDKTISLASPKQGVAVSPPQGRLLAQAWTQRAAIFWAASKDLSLTSTSIVDLGSEETPWRLWDSTGFEEEASRCFYMAGLYGSEVGRAMAVIANPHARLCGNIVKEALKRERCSS
jgi:hypothetical protein